MHTEPNAEHHWLQKLVGEWTYETEAEMGPGQPLMKATGSETVRSLGGLWTLAEGRGEMPDGMMGYTLMTLGYDPRRKRYSGTWIGSMMTHLWIYDGWVDDSGKVLTLESEGPSMTSDDKMAKYRDVIEWRDDDHRLLNALVQQADGTWHQFMTAHYRRKK